MWVDAQHLLKKSKRKGNQKSAAAYFDLLLLLKSKIELLRPSSLLQKLNLKILWIKIFI